MDDTVEVNALIVAHEPDELLRVRVAGREYLLKKSRIERASGELTEGNTVSIEIPAWLAKKSGMVS